MIPAIIVVGIYLWNKFYSLVPAKSRAKFYVKTADSEKECAVCLTNDSFGFRVVLECGHVFHKACLVEWVREKSTCPYCRAGTTVGV